MQLRFAVCIPVYNHPTTIADVINDCLNFTTLPIFVIDDGSDQAVELSYRQKMNFSEDKPLDRLTFVRLVQNRGKGFAIRTAINMTVKLGYTHLITIDADGQHLPEEINKLVSTSTAHPWAFVLGDRQMKTQNVPTSSVVGKRISNFWIKYETGKFVGDSQSGFRIYPLFHLQAMNFSSERYDFETEVLTRLLWKGVEVQSPPITVRYFTSDKRVTHFNKFKDNVRLTLLNAILVIISLLRRDDSPFKSALATAIGVFVGCLPFYGLHSVIVFGVAVLFRMNFIYLWLGTQISVPPMIPFLIGGSHIASQWYFGHPPQGLFGFSYEWAVGISLFGAVAGLVAGLFVFIFKTGLRKARNLKDSKISVKSKDGPGISFMLWALRKFGLRTAYALLWLIVPYFYFYSFRARTAGNEYWKIVRPSLNYFQRQKKIMDQLFVFAKILTDRAYQKNFETTQYQIVEGEGLNIFLPTLKQSGKGHVMLQSHVGGWDIALSYFRHLKLDKKMLAVMFGVDGSYDHSSIRKKDDQLQVTAFNKQQDTIAKLKSYLDKGEVVGLMGDRAVGRSYELVPFFGKLGLFDTSAIRLAQLTDANLFFIFCVRLGYKKYYVNAVMADTTSETFLALSREDRTFYLVSQYVNSLEFYLKKHPEQWFNFFPFWSEKLI